jgi:hypothetical protein
MNPSSRPWAAGRLLVTGFCWLTAAYACVASSTFASLQFLQPRVFPWVGTFSDWHAAASWVWLALAGAVLRSDIRRGGIAGRVAIVLLTAAAGAVLWSTLSPALPSLAGGSRPLVVAVVAFGFAVAFAAVDHLAAGHGGEPSASAKASADTSGPPARLACDEGRLLVVAVATALLVTALYAALASISMAGAFEPDLLTEGLATGLAWSLVDHLWMACTAFLVVAIVERLAARHVRVRYTALVAGLTAAFALAFARLVGVPLGMRGLGGAAVAVAFGMSVAATWGGLRLRRLSTRGVGNVAPIDVFLGAPAPARTAARSSIAILALGGLAFAAMSVARLADWDFVVLKAGVLAVWTTAFGIVHRMTTSRPRVPAWTIAVVCLLPLVAQQTLHASADQRRMLARYEVYNPSFRLAHGLLHDVAATPSFDRFLRANTNVDAALSPARLDFVPELAPSALPVKPLIFVFVVDSLRPDYLGSYNAAVRFTPRLDAFAAESLVFRNAFTRFGGTGLSVPAIWAGSALVHKQYVQPFHPTNTLEKLLDVNGYRKLIGRDSIMGRLLLDSPKADELDAGATTMDYRLCGTLDQLESKLAALAPGTPAFGYSLPQDVHMSRLPAAVESGPEYRGFHAPYATKVHAIDACFGRFVDALKARGLYDRSVIVLTSDHGEMLGEDGRFGHSTHLFPQVIRVPLIVHLPAELAARAAVDLDAVALSTDITPTIYSALGYAPAPANPLMGRSLVAMDAASAALRRREPVVIASSYGPVYAVLQQNGQQLYIADALSGTDLAYRRQAAGTWVSTDVSPEDRTVNQFLIRQHIDEVSRVFHVDDASARHRQH